MDLLTAVMHEMGHVLGLPDLSATASSIDLMDIDLVSGERRLPDTADVAQAQGTQTASTAGAADVAAGVLASDATTRDQTATSDPAAPVDRTSGDTIDLSSLLANLHLPSAGADVRALEDPSDTFATLQVSSEIVFRGDPSASGASTWTNVTQLDGVHAGDVLNVQLDPALAAHHITAGWLV